MSSYFWLSWCVGVVYVSGNYDAQVSKSIAYMST